VPTPAVSWGMQNEAVAKEEGAPFATIVGQRETHIPSRPLSRLGTAYSRLG
jgi:hypothetical protein